MALHYFCFVIETLLHKRFLILVFASIYLFGLFKPLGAIIHYASNYGLYANELCENKDQPKLKCHGTCVLAKKLKRSQEKEKAPSLPLCETLEWYMALLLEPKGETNFGYSLNSIPHKIMSHFKSPFIDLDSPPPLFLG